MKFIDWPVVIILTETWKKWRKDNTSGMAAALSYYALFAAVPVLILIIASFGTIYGQTAIQNEITGQISNLLGADVASFLLSLVDATRGSNGTIISLSTLFLIIGSFGVFNQLRLSLNRIWQAPVREMKPWRRFISNLSAFALIFLFGFLLLSSAVISAIITILRNSFQDSLVGVGFYMFFLDIFIFLIMSWVLISIIFYVSPNIYLKFKNIALGAMFTAILFAIGRIAMNIYLNFRSIDSVYGAASSAIAFLLWIYISALLFYFGAELTYVYAHREKYLNKS